MRPTQQELLRVIDRFPQRTVVVIGDLIADEFLYGQIARVSREAPVLVLEHRRLDRLPGGASNAANNLLDLGCGARVIAAAGRDAAGRHLVATLRHKGADVRNIARPRDYATPVKTRILAGAHHSSPQQVVRIDRLPEPATVFRHPWGKVRQALRGCDAVLLSDYGYGSIGNELLDGLCRESRRRRIPLVVDSRFDMDRFKDVTAITPNITELEAATGVSIGSDERLLRKTAVTVLRRQKLVSLLVTQGRFGMTLFQRGRPPVHIPVFGTDEVADVTGAGDTVIAVFTLALACGATHVAAARLANYAGGIVVMKRGTATVHPNELRSAIERDFAASPH